MSSQVPYPHYLPVPSSELKRSRHPLLVLGPRGPRVRGRDRIWTVEEIAVHGATDGGPYPAWHLGPWIDLADLHDEAQLSGAISRLFTLLDGAPGLGLAGIVVPRWNDLNRVDQERIHVAATSQLRADIGALTSGGQFTLGRRPHPLAVFHPGTPASPRLKPIPYPRALITSRDTHVDWLTERLPSATEVTGAFEMYLGGSDHPYRTFAAARDVAAELLTAGRSRPQVQTYLEVFGFQNSKGLVGVWPAKRLAEVAAVTR